MPFFFTAQEGAESITQPNFSISLRNYFLQSEQTNNFLLNRI